MDARRRSDGDVLRRVLVMLAVLAATAAFAACGDDEDSGGGEAEQPAAANTSNESFEWDFMVVQGATGKGGVGDQLQAFADEVDKRTDGRLKITLRAPGEVPYTMDKLLATVGAGRVEMGDLGIVSTGESKVIGMFGLPFLITSAEAHDKTVETLMPYLQEDLDKYGVTDPVFFYHQPVQTVWGQGDPPAQLSDLKGRQIRASSPEQAQLFEELGAKPATLIAAEVGSSLERNVIDSLASSGLNILATGWNESLDWGYTTPLGYLTGMIVVSQDAMDELPDDLRTTLNEVGQEFQTSMFDYIDQAEDDAREKLKEGGVDIVEGNPGDEQAGVEIMAPYWEKWAQDNGQTDALRAVRSALGN